jgi:hypothetical protein
VAPEWLPSGSRVAPEWLPSGSRVTSIVRSSRWSVLEQNGHSTGPAFV